MKLHKICSFIPILLILLGSQQVKASHLHAAEITYKCLGINQYVIQVETYQDCNGVNPSNSININADATSCSINQFLSLPVISITDISYCFTTTSPCQGGPGEGVYHCIYSDTFTLFNCPDWIFSYTGCCRGSSIVNLSNASTSIYTSASLDNSSQCNHSVQRASDAYLLSYIGNPQVYHPSCYDFDGDSLVYTLTNPLGANGIPEPYGVGYSAAAPLGTGSPITMDANTGAITFTLNTIGVFIVGLQVEEFRNGNLIATSNKDFAILGVNHFLGNSIPDYSITNVQGGYFDDNIFYVTDPTQLTFDVLGTDTADLGDILTVNSSIDSIGGSFIITGSNPITASFTWPTSTPRIQEFTIKLKDNVCPMTGEQRLGFGIVVLIHCIPDSIVGIVPPDSIFEISSNCANNNGFPITAITSPTTTTYGSLSIHPNQSSLLYQAGSSYEVQESFWVHFEMNGGLQSDSIWVDVTTTSCVWAGDADTNNIVNNFDLLPLGLGYGETGAVRPNTGIDYDCEPALNFVNNTPITGINYKHSDTNGDGIVNADDTTAILLNWGQIHLKNNSTTPLTAIPFYVEPTIALAGQMIQIPIILGDTSILADSIYGVAFTVNYDETMTDISSVSVDFNTSWLGTINLDMISVQKDFYYQGKIEVAVVRIDHTNRGGTGQIGTLNLTIKDDILRKSTTQRLDLLISNVRIITNTETERFASTPPTDILISTTTSTTDLTAATTYVNVFPNPAKTTLNIQSNDEIQWLRLYNLAGQEIQSVLVQDLNTQLNIQHLAQGMYVLKVQTTQGIQTQEVQIIR
ncbi:MAG: T9SS type A sorting domain-containing protein [Aureispira sp.]|nr:T9SS type A sorting domain-containing protein [Aureispira sp.]